MWFGNDSPHRVAFWLHIFETFQMCFFSGTHPKLAKSEPFDSVSDLRISRLFPNPKRLNPPSLWPFIFRGRGWLSQLQMWLIPPRFYCICRDLSNSLTFIQGTVDALYQEQWSHLVHKDSHGDQPPPEGGTILLLKWQLSSCWLNYLGGEWLYIFVQVFFQPGQMRNHESSSSWFLQTFASVQNFSEDDGSRPVDFVKFKEICPGSWLRSFFIFPRFACVLLVRTLCKTRSLIQAKDTLPYFLLAWKHCGLKTRFLCAEISKSRKILYHIVKKTRDATSSICEVRFWRL